MGRKGAKLNKDGSLDKRSSLDKKRNCLMCDKVFTNRQLNSKSRKTCSNLCSDKLKTQRLSNMDRKGIGGRHSIITPDIVQKLETAFAMDCTDPEACLLAGISERTLYNYQDKNPEFAQHKKLLKNKPFLLARSEVIKGMKNNPELSLKYLERKKKGEFSLKSEHGFTDTDGNDIDLNKIIGSSLKKAYGK